MTDIEVLVNQWIEQHMDIVMAMGFLTIIITILGVTTMFTAIIMLIRKKIDK